MLVRCAHPLFCFLLIAVLEGDPGIRVIECRTVFRELELVQDPVDHVLFSLKNKSEEDFVIDKLTRLGPQPIVLVGR